MFLVRQTAAIAVLTIGVSITYGQSPQRIAPAEEGLLATEKLTGDGVWTDPAIASRLKQVDRIQIQVWFDEQLLGDGEAYQRRTREFRDWRRGDLRMAAEKTLKRLSKTSYAAAEGDLSGSIDSGAIKNIEQHWIINGFACEATGDGIKSLQRTTGVKKVLLNPRGARRVVAANDPLQAFKPVERREFDPSRYKHPWYSRYLQADRVWKEYGATGQGTLNVIHDFNFVYSDSVTCNIYRNPDETPGNNKDDDGNGLIDDYHGYNFDSKSAHLTTFPVPLRGVSPQGMHGYMCAAIVCAAGTDDCKYEFGIAPEGSWAGIVASGRLEAPIEWAVEQGADTYSMSFSIPNLGEYRSHWRKVMEHGSLCGIYFVSGAGNFAQSARIPVQMRTPEDIPNVVFAAAGVQRNFQRTSFSSKGPVQWNTEHYKDGRLPKPEVCAFNMGLPLLLRDGSVRDSGLNGNSFAGPMFCGSIALMLSADPDLLPWDLRDIITVTATDVAQKGVDDETGHGLINCYLAVKETLRRKALREKRDATAYEGRRASDSIDIAAIRRKLESTRLQVVQVQPRSQAEKLGLQPGDIVARYNDVKVTNRQQLLAAKNEAASESVESVKVIVLREGTMIELEFATGALGFVPSTVYSDPTFE